MVTRAESLAKAVSAARRRPAEESSPNAWLWFCGRLLDLSEMPWPTQVRYWFWCRLLKQPRPDFYDIQGGFPTRAEARAECEGPLDYIDRMPFGRTYGRSVKRSSAYCRPLDPSHAAKDAADSVRYTEDLRGHINAELYARLAEIEAQLWQIVEIAKAP